MTKADFYIGNGITANWIGSIFKDGYPNGIPLKILICGNPTLFEEDVVEFIQRVEGVVKTNGDKWPWLWPDSQMTDFSYMFLLDHCKVFASHFGGNFFDPIQYIRDGDAKDVGLGHPVFPLKEAREWTESCPNYTEIMGSIQTTGTFQKR